MALMTNRFWDCPQVTYAAFMSPSSVKLESVHNTDGQRKVHFEKVLPLRNCLSGKNTLTKSSCFSLDV